MDERYQTHKEHLAVNGYKVAAKALGFSESEARNIASTADCIWLGTSKANASGS